MKAEDQIKNKIVEHESKINELISDTSEWSPFIEDLLERYLLSRKALLWVLSPEDNIKDDKFDEKVKYEIACYTSSKLF